MVKEVAPRTRERTRSNPGGEGSEIGKMMDDVKKRMGEGVVSLGMADVATTFIETGVFLLDMGLLGGVAESRITQIYGHSAAGKTTISSRLVAAAQRKHPDKVAVLLDVEGTFDRQWGERAGIDSDRLVYVQPETGEQAVDILEASIRSVESCIIVLDSLPALVPQTIIERSAEDKTMAARAALIGVACSKMLASLAAERKRKHYPAIIMTNQWRSKVGFVMGNPNILPGGQQPRYASSAMIEIKKRKEEMGKDRYDNDVSLYNEHAFDIDKSKAGASVRQGEFRLVTADEYECLDAPGLRLPAGSVDDYKVVATYAKRMGFITGGGASWTIDGIDRKFNKVETIVRFLAESPEEFILLKRKMIALRRSDIGLPPIPRDGYLLGYVPKGRK